VHRPGAELLRLTPRTNDSLIFDGLPWVARAQEEHDTFTDRMRDHGVEVLYLSRLLLDVLAVPEARAALVAPVLSDARLGEALRARVAGYLSYLDDESLAAVLTGGLAHDELRSGSGLVYAMLDRHDFVVDPLPHLLFTRDCGCWMGDGAVVASLTAPARHRESTLVEAVYRWHPRFLGTPLLYTPEQEPLDGGDVLVLGRGVLAVGVGGRTTPAGAERLARAAFGAGLAHTVLVVPIGGRRATLDTLCTVVDADAVLMYPDVADALVAYQLTRDEEGEPLVRAPRPFLAVAAEALELDRLRVIATGLDPVTAEREQWDDGGNTLGLAPGLCVAYERNAATNAELERAGIEVIRVPGAELGSRRGGPRCLASPVARDPLGPTAA
jgi:arginine deiminase